MSSLESLLERLVAAWDGLRRGLPLSPEQRAALIAQAWGGPRRYVLTQPCDHAKANALLAMALAVHRQERRNAFPEA